MPGLGKTILDNQYGARVENRRPDGCLCHRASLDDILSDDMMAPVLRSAGYEPNEFAKC